MYKMTCDLILTDSPTINGRIYSKECMEKILSDMRSLIEQNQLFVYISEPSNYQESPTFDKIVGKVLDVNLSDRFEYDVIKIDTKMSEIINLDSKNYEIIPAIYGRVNKNEISGHFEVSDVIFKHLSLVNKPSI